MTENILNNVFLFIYLCLLTRKVGSIIIHKNEELKQREIK